MASNAPPTTSLAKRSAASALMPPPPAPKRIKRPAIVLDEETYTSALRHIIGRDFYPGFAQNEALSEYMNALDSKDKGWIREAGKKLTQVMRPVSPGARQRKKTGAGGQLGGPSKTPSWGRGGSATPRVWGRDTPLTLGGSEAGWDEGDEEDGKPEVDLNLSLSAFQAKYISEDQESFSQLIDRQNAKKFASNEWLRTGNRLPSKQRLAQQKVLEAAASKKAAALTSSSTNISQEVALRPSQDLDARPAHVSTHKHAPFNTLMFAPDSIESWAPTRAQLAETASLAPPKAVVYQNTRLPPESDIEDPPRPASPTMSAVRDAITGNPRLGASEFGDSGNETPRVKGYAFVHDEDPADDDDDAPTDLLERYGVKADPNPFTIHNSQRREKLHLKMVERIGSNQKQSDGGSETASKSSSGLAFLKSANTPRFLSAPTPTPRDANVGMTPGRKNLGSLTPAAQRLFQRVGGAAASKGVRDGGFGGGKGSGSTSALGREWTPTPRVTPRRKK